MIEKVRFTDYADRYVLERDLSAVYASTLLSRARKLDAFFGKPLYVSDLTEGLINKFLLHLQSQGANGSKLSPEGIRGYRRNLLSLWNGAADDELCGYPMMRRVRKLKRNPPVPTTWTQEQVEQLVEFIEQLPGKTPSGILSRLYWSACVRVGYDTALRSCDVIKLRREDIGPTGIVAVCMSKTRVRHLSKLRQSTMDAISATFPPERELIFEFSACRRSWFRAFECLVQFSGLPKGSFKYLRHTSSSLVEALEPGSGSKHLGHKSPGLFASNYEDVNLSRPNITQPPELKIVKGGAV